MREFDRVKAHLLGDGHPPVDPGHGIVVIKREILEPEGAMMPLNASAVRKMEGLEADSAPDELRRVADCRDAGAEGHAERLRRIADALENAPGGPDS